jgi:hypothetical protein
MKFLVLILGSTTLVAGGTAITSQQDARNNMTAHQRPYQEHQAASRGTDCPPVATPIFDNVAHPLTVDFCQEFYSGNQDVNGDGTVDGWECFFMRSLSNECTESSIINKVDLILHYVPGSNSPEVRVESFLDLNPDSMKYVGIDFPYYGVHITKRAYLDVTDDGRPDAIIEMRYETECNQEFEVWEIQYFYIENMLPPPAAACTTDVNSDGSTNVNDLLEVVANWGACP